MTWIRRDGGVYMAGVVVVFGRRVWNRMERHFCIHTQFLTSIERRCVA